MVRYNEKVKEIRIEESKFLYPDIFYFIESLLKPEADVDYVLEA